jgi:hypothetical protein
MKTAIFHKMLMKLLVVREWHMQEITETLLQ